MAEESNDRLARAEGFAIAGFMMTLTFLHRAVARREMTKEHAALIIAGAREISKTAPFHDPAAMAYAEKILKLAEDEMRSGNSAAPPHSPSRSN